MENSNFPPTVFHWKTVGGKQSVEQSDLQTVENSLWKIVCGNRLWKTVVIEKTRGTEFMIR